MEPEGGIAARTTLPCRGSLSPARRLDPVRLRWRPFNSTRLFSHGPQPFLAKPPCPVAPELLWTAAVLR